MMMKNIVITYEENDDNDRHQILTPCLNLYDTIIVSIDFQKKNKQKTTFPGKYFLLLSNMPFNLLSVLLLCYIIEHCNVRRNIII